MGTRAYVLAHACVCSCARVRSRAGADDERIRGMCASAARSLCSAIDGTLTYTGYVYTMHACIYIHARLAVPTNGSPMRGPPRTRTDAAPRAHVLRPCARACVRVRSGAHVYAPTHASAFRRRRPRAARRAGVQRRVGVQRGHRRVEHRVCHHVVLRMLRLSGPGGAPPQAGRARPGRRCSAGRCVRRHRRCARAGVCADVWARACAGVHVCRYSCA
jgi:hypothetical protein